MDKIMVMHGVNLNMLGLRNIKQYGTVTLADINARLLALAGELGLDLEFFQTNIEGEFVGRMHSLHGGEFKGLLVNPGAWTHYSYAVMDAAEDLNLPIVEVHMSNIHAREEFRHFSILAKIARGSIVGLGVDSYLLGLRALANIIMP